MNRIFKYINENKIILLILILAFLIRAWGIYFDFPGTRYIEDETYHVSYIVKALSEKTFYPDVILQYPALLTILYFPAVVLKIVFIMIRESIHNISELKTYMIIQGMGELFVLTRWYSVVFGTATVYFLYRIGELIWRKRSVALIISLFFVFNLIFVYISHWGRMHSALILFLVMSLYFSLLFEKKKQARFFYLSNLFAVLSIGSHYLGVNAIIFPFLNWWRHRSLVNKKIIIKTCLIYFAGFFVFYLLNFSGFKWMFFYNLYGYYLKNEGGGLSNIGIAERFYFVFRDGLLVAPVESLFFLFSLWFIKRLWQNVMLRYLLIGIIFNYFIMITIVASPHNARMLAVYVCYITIIGIGFFFNRLEKNLHNRLLIYVGVFLFILPSMFISLKYSWLLNRNTLMIARNWIIENISSGDIVYSFNYKIEVPLSVAAARWQSETNHVASAKDEYIIQNSDQFEDQGYNLFYDFDNKRFEELGGQDTNYVLISYGNPDYKKYLLDNLEMYHNLKLVKTFYPLDENKKTDVGDIVNNPFDFRTLFNLNKSGPFIEIYKL